MWGSQIEWLELQAKQAYHDQDISIDCGSIDCKAQWWYAYQLVLLFGSLFSRKKSALVFPETVRQWLGHVWICFLQANVTSLLKLLIPLVWCKGKKVSFKSSRKSETWVMAHTWRGPPFLTCLMWQLNLHIYDVFYSKANNDPRMKTDCLITHILILPVRPSPCLILQIAFQFPWKMPIFLPYERISSTASGL